MSLGRFENYGLSNLGDTSIMDKATAAVNAAAEATKMAAKASKDASELLLASKAKAKTEVQESTLLGKLIILASIGWLGYIGYELFVGKTVSNLHPKYPR